jgi:flagellar basal body P-ring protein FlgI
MPPITRRWMTRRTLGLLSVSACAALAASGCTEEAPKVNLGYVAQPAHEVPAYMKGSVYEVTDMTGTEPAPVSGYGLVANLRGTGGCRAPTAVRDYMIKELARHHYGSLDTGWESPDKILDSKNFSIVRVEGYLPPGCRAGTDWSDWFDVRLSALPESEATSLAHGDLYECDLKVGGANPLDPGNGMVDVKAQAAGSVFVNPTYVNDADTDTAAARASRRSGFVLAGARVMEDRPLVLHLRAPEKRTARAIERRILERFQDVADDDLQPHGNSAAKKVANAMDEASVEVFVPKAFRGHWDHFVGIVRHLYLAGGDPAFAALRARDLADAAVLPDARLLDISYAWEGLGKSALYALGPLMTDPMPIEHFEIGLDGKPVVGRDGRRKVVETRMEHHADIRFAAARAAAFIGDPAAVPVLAEIASTVGDPFRVNAVEVLGELPSTPIIASLCRPLLDSDEATVRIAAYQLLTRYKDPSIYTRWVRDGDKEIFALDIVRGGHRAAGQRAGRPMVYATQQGVPRVAIFGADTTLELPLIFSTLDDGRLMICTNPGGDGVSITYRSPYRRSLVTVNSTANLPELVAHLGGDGSTTDSGSKLHLSYADVVAVLQALVTKQKVSGSVDDGATRLAATFVLGDPSMAVKLPKFDEDRLVRRASNGRPLSDKPVDRAAAASTDDSDLVRNKPDPALSEADAAARALATAKTSAEQPVVGNQAAVTPADPASSSSSGLNGRPLQDR